ncbi:MAG: lytic transglycosylase domain-containing protein [Flavobacteriales bacterium]|nr:lytic transglycosylase domain-containing protein [Flavobacteriales bacterium]
MLSRFSLKFLRRLLASSLVVTLACTALIVLQGSSNKKLKKQEPPPPANMVVEPEPLLEPAVIDATNLMFELPELPNEITFCGEVVPLSDREVAERLERELAVNTFWHSNTFLLLKRTGRYFPLIEKILQEEGIPDDFKYLALAESGLLNARSGAGAAGFWQFLKATGIKHGLEVRDDVDERYNLEKATKAACEYLREAKEEFGNWTLAAAAYNRGENGLARAIGSQKVKSYYDLYLNPETSRYVFRILSLKLIHSDPKQYKFNIEPSAYYKPLPTYDFEVNNSIEDLPKFALEHGTNYKTLHELNPWLRTYELPNKSRKKYVIHLPYLESQRADD